MIKVDAILESISTSSNITLDYKIPDISTHGKYLIEATTGPIQPTTTGTTTHSQTMQIKSPVALWWPRGYGSQPLYQLQVYQQSKQVLTKTIAFRTVELVRDAIKRNATSDPLEEGHTFYFRINNVPIYAKGSNMVPADTFEDDATEQRFDQLIDAAIQSNQNMLRVWGGGVYYPNYFYETCSRLGLMVWNEFMFACSIYPRHPSFLDNVKVEISQQVGRLVNQPSVVMWSGNNENEMVVMTGWFQPLPRYVADYEKLYIETIRSTLIQKDQSRPFWPSSPSNGPIVDDGDFYVLDWTDPGSTSRGDSHQYDYMMKCDDVTKLSIPRFLSEYGFQSFPSTQTMMSQTNDPNDLIFNSTFLQDRQRSPSGTDVIIAHVRHRYRIDPDSSLSYSDLSYKSQINQAYCIRFKSEYLRARKIKEYQMGLVYWQLNDVWSGPTWSSVDHGGNWKALHYAVKKFFAPIIITSSLNNKTKNWEVHVVSDVNDKVEDMSASIRAYDYEKGLINVVEINKFDLNALDAKTVFSVGGDERMDNVLFKGVSRPRVALWLQLYDGVGNFIADNEYLMSDVKDAIGLQKCNPKITSYQKISVLQVSFVVVSDVTCLYVWMESGDKLKGRFSDNAFVLWAKEPRKISFICKGDCSGMSGVEMMSEIKVAKTMN
ncbi:beta-mannosidase [Acrasis kona]|uniref:beta-mannosidase n=1 Tax=Acrasis kona TaxID=1008807 RepID=A0AAW2YHR2_9EUKA